MHKVMHSTAGNAIHQTGNGVCNEFPSPLPKLLREAAGDTVEGDEERNDGDGHAYGTHIDENVVEGQIACVATPLEVCQSRPLHNREEKKAVLLEH